MTHFYIAVIATRNGGRVLGDAPRSALGQAFDDPDIVIFNGGCAERRRSRHEPDHQTFLVEELPFLFNQGPVARRVTYWPSGFFKRIRGVS